MRILHWDFSERFTEYLGWFRTVSSKHIQFYYMDEHPDRGVHGRPAMVEISKQRAHVFIHRSIDRYLAEENAAHELTHLALLDMGYCYPVLQDPHAAFGQQIVNGLLSWTADVIIDRKLEEFGYDNQEYKQMVWENTRHHLEIYPRESQPGAEEIFNALGYFYCYHSVTKAQWDILKDLYERVDPPAWVLGERIISLGKTQDIFTAAGYCSLLVSIRDDLKLEGTVGIFQPDNGTML